jgi:hypothetical protein
MLQPRRSLFPILAGTVSLIVGLTILAVGVVLLFWLFGLAVHVIWFALRLAVILTLITVGVRLVLRRR